MAKETFIATVQIVIHPDENIENESAACDWFSGLLSENLTEEGKVLDWQYLRLGGHQLTPSKILVDESYEEGEAF